MLIHKTKEVLAKIKNINLEWVKNHNGDVGNKYADDLAKLGVRKGPLADIPVSRSLAKLRINQKIRSLWEEMWRGEPTCRQTKLFFPSPQEKNIIKSLTKYKIHTLVMLVTGHGLFQGHLSQWRDMDALCDRCEVRLTACHLFQECP